jgi:hypothetical protein
MDRRRAEMMTRKYEFYLGTGFRGCTHKEIVEIDFEGDETEEEIEDIVNEWYDDWVGNKLDRSWKEIEEDEE